MKLNQKGYTTNELIVVLVTAVVGVIVFFLAVAFAVRHFFTN